MPEKIRPDLEELLGSLRDTIGTIDDEQARTAAEDLLNSMWRVCQNMVKPRGSGSTLPSSGASGGAPGGAGSVIHTACPKCRHQITLTLA